MRIIFIRMKSKISQFGTLVTNDCLYHLITQSSLAITAELRKSFMSAGIDHVRPAYLGILMCLWKEDSFDEALGKLGSPGGMKISDLGKCAGLEPSTMTGLLDRMERDGLVRREDDPADRRAQRIRLTDAGANSRKNLVSAVDSALHRAFAGIDEKALDEMKLILRKVLANTDRGNIT